MSVTPGQILDVLLEHRRKVGGFEVSYGWEMATVNNSQISDVNMYPKGGLHTPDVRPEIILMYITPEVNHVHIFGSGWVSFWKIVATYRTPKISHEFRPYE